MANKKIYDTKACMILYRLGYSYQDIADIYSVVLGRTVDKSSIYRVIETKGVKKYDQRVNPKLVNQKVINYLQEQGLYLILLELYNKKYVRPVKDTRFGYGKNKVNPYSYK